MLKNIRRYHKNFKKYLEKLQKYQDNITYGLNYLFNEEDSYKQQKSRVLLMVAMYYMKVEEIKMLN